VGGGWGLGFECAAMRCRGDELRPICVAGLLTRMAF